MNASLTAALERATVSHHWSEEYGRIVAREYERFIRLAQDFRAVPLVPARDVDLLWHEHLAGASYADDFAGPAPRHGTHTTPDHAVRFETTRRLYREQFGDPGAMWTQPAECQVDDPGKDPGDAPWQEIGDEPWQEIGDEPEGEPEPEPERGA